MFFYSNTLASWEKLSFPLRGSMLPLCDGHFSRHPDDDGGDSPHVWRSLKKKMRLIRLIWLTCPLHVPHNRRINSPSSNSSRHAWVSILAGVWRFELVGLK